SICTLHAPKYIPKIIAAHGHAFLTFGFQKGDFAGFLQLLAKANLGNGAKSRETNVRNGFSILENVGIYCFRAFPWKKFSTVPWGGNTLLDIFWPKIFFMEKRENSGFLGIRVW